MKRILTVAITLIFAFSQACIAQETCKRHTEPEGGFSFCPPEGWTIAEDSRLKFKAVYGPQSDGFTPNINIIKVNDPVSLKETVSISIEHYPASAKRLGATYIKFLDQSEFTTASEQQGFKLLFQSENKGLLLRTTQYLFSGSGDDKLLITCTALEKDSKILEPLFDRFVKTLQIDK